MPSGSKRMPPFANPSAPAWKSSLSPMTSPWQTSPTPTALPTFLPSPPFPAPHRETACLFLPRASGSLAWISGFLPPHLGIPPPHLSPIGNLCGSPVACRSRLRSVGHVNRHLCVLACPLPLSTCPSWSVPIICTSGADPKPVGTLTSSVAIDGQALALAMIQRSHADPGNSVLAGGMTWTILRHA
jgi:hypothetical protein